FIFFFQAEDGIRDKLVTGVQTCALPILGAAALITVVKGMITRADLAFTGLADTPFLAPAAAKLVGTQGQAELIAEVAAASVAGVEANDDIHASAAYRTHLGMVAARRALAQALARAG